MLQKTIIQGRIEYGTEKSFKMALKMYNQRAEKYYKNDVLFEPEEIFFEEGYLLNIPRFVKQVYPKTLRNTATLLEYVVQFGVSGQLNFWALDEGKILMYKLMEPSSDKVAVQQYIKGKSLMDQKGKEEEAIVALNKAIEKYDRHAQAYERRAKVNFMLKKDHDALRDYNKSIGLDPSNPYAYLGKAEVYIYKREFAEAIDALQMTIKKSVALQAVHWQGRRLKGKLHLKLKQFKEAEFELKLFTNRAFKEGNPNLAWKRDAFFDYGHVQMALEDFNGAVNSFDKACTIESGNDKLDKGKRLRFRGIAKQKAGQNGYKTDIKEAAEAGDKVAKKLLEELS
ncbi:MAG: hypothetical protein HKO66_15660 [Saprospiraceae bacterium]|nr:hypothetical protein [Bacteroidia bacterium]NNE15957.1 hypothetical protein [Saprospiraceae bacterium]NNL93678.1 hypothetical protein [Saprospiraceae bacterium]